MSCLKSFLGALFLTSFNNAIGGGGGIPSSGGGGGIPGVAMGVGGGGIGMEGFIGVDASRGSVVWSADEFIEAVGWN